ncbi:glycosyltransferase family 2 protein [Nocardioides sp.]|uniref:glycosyltransferase family 2 protein n=1 Tax=Nocardioides sp. TaxID=35761 RepID=UPI00351588A5
MQNTCTLVLPCLDEGAALRHLLPQVPPGLAVVVVDNGSTDDTAEVARAHGALVVHEERRGYGAAVHRGIEAAATDLVAVMDGDGSMLPRDLAPLIDQVSRGAATMAVGRRRPVRRGVWPWHARLGNRVALAVLRRRTGVRLHDIAPVRVCGRAELLALGVEDRRFGYPVELLARASRAGWVIDEHDIEYHPRTAGTRSKVSGSVRGTVRAARDFASVLR